MNFLYLNKMVEYIEDNLDDVIDYNMLSKIVNTNIFILERIFMFLTNMTINEYIKMRRLSKAFEDIRNTDKKIIDIALKYQYNSATSFSRAFKKLFNITPSECRKSNSSYKIIPKLYFESNNDNYNFDYNIKKINSISLYCYHVKAKSHSNLLYKIKELYEKIKINGRYEQFNETGMYGVFSKEEGVYHYYLGSTLSFLDLEILKIEENQCAEFKLNTRNQEKIVALQNRINKQWILSTNYNVKNNLKIEFYKKDECYIYLPIK